MATETETKEEWKTIQVKPETKDMLDELCAHGGKDLKYVLIHRLVGKEYQRVLKKVFKKKK